MIQMEVPCASQRMSISERPNRHHAGTWADRKLPLEATEGTPQGGVISPILSNIFLHHVLDKWFEDVVRPRMRGEATLVRFADDFVMTFENYYDAKRVTDVLGNRMRQ
jgi:retron-type reverse transcriptase